MVYEIVLTKRVAKDLDKLDNKTYQKIYKAINSLKNNPYPNKFKFLKSPIADCRIRVGDFRILYDANNKEKTVIILRIGHRKDVY